MRFLLSFSAAAAASISLCATSRAPFISDCSFFSRADCSFILCADPLAISARRENVDWSSITGSALTGAAYEWASASAFSVFGFVSGVCSVLAAGVSSFG